MKKLLITLFAVTALSTASYAQTAAAIVVDAEHILDVESKQNYGLALSVGLINWQKDYGAIGVIRKSYDNKVVAYGLRLSAMIRLIGDNFVIYMANDFYAQKPIYYKYVDIDGITKYEDKGQRLELGVGLGYRLGTTSLTLGVRSTDFDTSNKFLSSPAVVIKLTHALSLKDLDF
jgi:hypothetical protein